MHLAFRNSVKVRQWIVIPICQAQHEQLVVPAAKPTHEGRTNG